MASFWCCALLLSLVAAGLVNADMKLDCRPDYMTLVWTESRPQADTSLLRLGSCFPTSVTVREAVFSVDLNDCHFRRLVTGNHLMYTNDLIYYSPPNSLIPSFTLPVVCAYERPKDWFPAIYEPVFSTFSRDDLVFHFGLMNVAESIDLASTMQVKNWFVPIQLETLPRQKGSYHFPDNVSVSAALADFSGPAESTSFSLGSFIPIMASVEQQHHQPLLLLLDECVAATTPELQHESNLYPIITNKGCLMDSKTSRSKYEPRVKTSEIRLSLQAFKFALGEDVFIHCNLVAWDPNALDHTKKACHYVKDHGWELLDHPTYSTYCDCCETSCKSRKTRSLASGKHGVERKAVLGPITVTDS